MVAGARPRLRLDEVVVEDPQRDERRRYGEHQPLQASGPPLSRALHGGVRCGQGGRAQPPFSRALTSQRSTEARVPGVSAALMSSRGPSAAAMSSALSKTWITTAVRWSGS